MFDPDTQLRLSVKPEAIGGKRSLFRHKRPGSTVTAPLKSMTFALENKKEACNESQGNRRQTTLADLDQ